MLPGSGVLRAQAVGLAQLFQRRNQNLALHILVHVVGQEQTLGAVQALKFHADQLVDLPLRPSCGQIVDAEISGSFSSPRTS